MKHLNVLSQNQFFLVILLSILVLLNSCEQTDIQLKDTSVVSLKHITLSDEVQEKITYGPEQFIRADGESSVYEVGLNSDEFTCHQPPYVLTVVNGEEDGSYRVTSARVLLDGLEIFKQSDFKKKVETLEQTIEITTSSVLQVEINGKPDSYIHVYITGEKKTMSGTGLLAYYPFNGNANDESGNMNDGLLQGASPANDRNGMPNSAYYFDGVDDFIDIPNPYDNDIFSANVWVKVDPNDLVGTSVVDGWGASGELLALSYGNADLPINVARIGYDGLDNYAYGSFHPWKDDNYKYHERHLFKKLSDLSGWHMLTITYEFPYARFYFDSNLVFEFDFTGMTSSTKIRPKSNLPLIEFQIGRDRSNIHFKGWIDEVRLYNRELSEHEIGNLFNCD